MADTPPGGLGPQTGDPGTQRGGLGAQATNPGPQASDPATKAAQTAAAGRQAASPGNPVTAGTPLPPSPPLPPERSQLPTFSDPPAAPQPSEVPQAPVTQPPQAPAAPPVTPPSPQAPATEAPAAPAQQPAPAPAQAPEAVNAPGVSLAPNPPTAKEAAPAPPDDNPDQQGAQGAGGGVGGLAPDPAGMQMGEQYGAEQEGPGPGVSDVPGNDTNEAPDPKGDPGDGAGVPVELDLTGHGIGITELTASNTFQKIDSDGYEHRTAWAAAGDAVLFFDPTSADAIVNSDQYIFTQLDPSATSDMQALKDVFDTNHDGSLDAGDAAFSEFKLMVTNADGTTSVETLAQAGITSIALSENDVTRGFADGSSIDGEATYTRTDGSTGTAATVSYAEEVPGYAVTTTTTQDGNGDTVVDNRALNADGSLANETMSTTSADGLTRSVAYDDAGNGVINQTLTDDTTVASDGSRTEVVSEYDGQGVLLDSTSTTTSADGSQVSIARDLLGGGVIGQTETRTTAADGTITDVVTNLNQDGSTIDQSVKTFSADGLSSTTQIDTTGAVDANGKDVFDQTTTDATVVNPDGSRVETITDANFDGSEIDQTVITTSADQLSRTVQIDHTGHGTFDETDATQITDQPDGSVTTTATVTNSDGSVRSVSATNVSADGLSRSTTVDRNGDGNPDVTISAVTVDNADGSQTETDTDYSGSGTVLSQTMTQIGADGVSRTVTTTDAHGYTTATETIAVNPNGGTTDTATDYAEDGSVIDRSVSFTTPSGLYNATHVDLDGDGASDLTYDDNTVEHPNGSASEVLGKHAGDGSLITATRIDTSADGLTTVTAQDRTGATNADGSAVFDRTTTDQIVNTDDGSRVETATVTSQDGTVLSTMTSDLGAGRQSSHTEMQDADGATLMIEDTATAADGTTTDTTQLLNPDGSSYGGSQTTTSANGLDVTTSVDALGQFDSDGNEIYTSTTTDDVVIRADGARVET